MTSSGPQTRPVAVPLFDAKDTLSDVTRRIALAFDAAGIVDAGIDARFLVQGVLDLDAVALLRDGATPVGARADDLTRAVARRLAHEPVARILGRRDFYGRTFRVTPAVLDPRPDTETLVDLVLDIVRADRRLSRAVTIADIGVGSGAIIATLLAELPHARGIGTDVSAAALAVARQNGDALGVGARLDLIETDCLSGISAAIDIVVSNPPYIPTQDISALREDVKAFDPRLALDGGPDGLHIYRSIAAQALSRPSVGWLCLEVGATQHAEVEALFEGAGAVARMQRTDLGGHIRAVALEIQH